MTTSEKITRAIGTNLKTAIGQSGWVKNVIVRSTNEDTTFVNRHGDNQPRTIINFKACTEYQAKVILKKLKEVGGPSNLSEEELSNLSKNHLTYSFPTEFLESNASLFVPAEGEPVNLLIVEDTNKQGQKYLRVDRMKPVGEAVTKSYDLSSFGDFEESTEEQTVAEEEIDGAIAE